MDIRKAIDKLLIENNDKHEYGCAMLYFDFPQMFKIQDYIRPEDLYEEESLGLESEPHCTLLFGFHENVTTEDIARVIDNHDLKIPFILHNISIFNNPDCDVLKFDVGYKIKGGDVLGKVNNQLKSFPHTEDFPEYHPHVTIAYLKKGTGSKYVGAFEGIQFDLSPSYAAYSKSDGTVDKIKI